MRLFGREWYLQIGSLDLTDVDLSFKIARSVRREPGIAEIRVWNLSPESRASVEASARREVVRLRAGYEDPPLLYRGDVRAAWTEREGSDYVTIVQARDGGRAYSEARVSRAYAPGTPVSSVVRDLVSDLDVGEGNLADFLTAYALRTGADTFADGFVADGSAAAVLSGLVRGAGLRWSIQNGAIQIMRRGEPLPTRSVVLSADTGLIESPSWTDARRKRTAKARCLIQPGIEPGRKVYLDSALISGDFEVRAVEYAGDTRGNDWHAGLELRAVG